MNDNARRIANVLGLRSTRQQKIPGQIVNRIHRLLVAAKGTGVYSRLVAICEQIQPIYKRPFITCLVLLDRIWLVPPGTQMATDVVRLTRESFISCDRATFKTILRDELMEKQWSSFPLVRRVASQIREIELVEFSEVNMLLDNRAFPEIRIAIARRILLHRQKEHVNALLDYLIKTVRFDNDGGDERQQALDLLRKMSDFGMSEVLVPLFKAYVEHFAEDTPRGYLMAALSRFEEPLVPQLEELYKRDSIGERRQPITRLLRQMIARGSHGATRALADIVTHAHHSEFDDAARNLLTGAREQAAAGRQSENAWQIRNELETLARKLNDSVVQTHRGLGQDLTAIGWDGAITEDLIERVVAQTATREEYFLLRHGGRRALDLLLTIIECETRTTGQRTAALKSLPKIFGVPGRSGPEGLLWRLYKTGPKEEVRLAALRCLADLQLDPPDVNARELLFQDYQGGTPSAQQVISECWMRLFPQALPPGRSLGCRVTGEDHQ